MSQGYRVMARETWFWDLYDQYCMEWRIRVDINNGRVLEALLFQIHSVHVVLIVLAPLTSHQYISPQTSTVSSLSISNTVFASIIRQLACYRGMKTAMVEVSAY